MFFYRPRSSSTSSSAVSSTSSSPAFHSNGWMPSQATVSPAATITMAGTDYFTCKPTTDSAAASLRRDSTSSTTSTAPSITFSASSPLSPSIAYPSWAETHSSVSRHAGQSGITSQQLPPTYIASSYISNDDLEALDFSAASRKASPHMSAVCEPEFDAGAAGISWSTTQQPCVPQREERRRRLPPPPPGMMTTTGGRSGSKRKSSKERRQKALSMIKE